MYIEIQQDSTEEEEEHYKYHKAHDLALSQKVGLPLPAIGKDPHMGAALIFHCCYVQMQLQNTAFNKH
jgi:hypothetical protein